MKAVSLHHHTTGSYGDGFGPPEDHMARAADLGYGALALTEHGNTSTHPRHEKAGLKYGVKTLFGCELYTASEHTRRKWHLTALAMTQPGYINLNRLVTRSWAEGFYQFPTVLGPMLTDHQDGLIVLSGCADSLLACTLLGGKGVDPHPADMAGAERVIRRFKELLGDRYYLEVQRFPQLKRACTINQAYEVLSARTGVPLVATADCHYPLPTDNQMQKILHAARRSTGTVAAAEATWEYDILLTLPLSDEEWLTDLRGTGLSKRAAERALAATADIADRCNVTLPKADLFRYPLDGGYDSATEQMWAWVRDGWRYRWGQNAHMRAHRKNYAARTKEEMEVIAGKDFPDYFLMVADLVKFAKDSNIGIGPGRGSVVGSLVAYLLRITEVDSMQFPVIFQRFIDPTRDDWPDIDLDFQDDRRDEVRQYAARKYGADRVGNIGNVVRYRGKNSLDDVGKVYRIPKAKVEEVKSQIVERSFGDARAEFSIVDSRHLFAGVQAVFDEYPELLLAERLEGNIRGFSVHAAGIVIANSPLNDIVATYTREVGEHKNVVQALSVDKVDAEYLRLLKVDALGLSTMGMIAIACEEIGMKLEDLYTVPLDDPKTMAAFTAADVTGIFQFEGRATRQCTQQVAPRTFMELSDINALSRPGPLFSGATSAYVATKLGRQKPQRLHPLIDLITKDTWWQIIYQEQILRIVREIGGFPWTDAGKIRKVIAGKKGEAAFNASVEQFLEGALRLHGIKRDKALIIWKQLVTSGTYAFNVAHTVSYSMLAFWCQWLRVHHPTAFYMAQLRKTPNDSKSRPQVARLIVDARRHDVPVLPPALATSGSTWKTSGKSVIAGLEQVPGIGEKTATAIMAEREARPFNSWSDLVRVKGVGPKTVRMIEDFCNSDDPFGIERVANYLNAVRKVLVPGNDWGIRVPTHNSDEIFDQRKENKDFKVVWVGLVRKKNLQDYVEHERAKTGKDMEQIRREMRDPNKTKMMSMYCYDDGEEPVNVRFSRWTYPRFATALEGVRPNRDVIVVTGKVLANWGPMIFPDAMSVIDPLEED